MPASRGTFRASRTSNDSPPAIRRADHPRKRASTMSRSTPSMSFAGVHRSPPRRSASCTVGDVWRLMVVWAHPKRRAASRILVARVSTALIRATENRRRAFRGSTFRPAAIARALSRSTRARLCARRIVALISAISRATSTMQEPYPPARFAGAISGHSQVLPVRAGKQHRERTAYVVTGGRAALDYWLKFRGDDPGPLLVPVSKSGTITLRRMSTQALLLRLRRRCEQAGVRRCAPHDLRRSLGDPRCGSP